MESLPIDAGELSLAVAIKVGEGAAGEAAGIVTAGVGGALMVGATVGVAIATGAGGREPTGLVGGPKGISLAKQGT